MKLSLPKIFLYAFCAFFTVEVSMAAPVTVEWTDSVLYHNLPGVTDGDPFTLQLILDNGGADAFNQTWTPANFVSATLNINGGAYTAQIPGPLGPSIGVFSTDAFGIITAAPISWVGINLPGIDSVSGPIPNSDLYVNGINEFWYSGPDWVAATNVTDNIVPANWSIVGLAPPPAAVPEPGTHALLVCLLGAAISLCRRRSRLAEEQSDSPALLV